MNFSYILFTGKHVSCLAHSNSPYFDEFDLVVDKDIPDVIITYGNVRSHLFKVLIQMLNPKTVGTSSSQVVVHNAKKDVETLCMHEDLASSDEGVFLDCSINNRAYIVFNKRIKIYDGIHISHC